MPAQDGVRGDDGRDLVEETTTEGLALGCESSALVVVEPEGLAVELFFEDAVLLDEVLDDLVLLAIEPAGERGQEDREGIDVGLHGAIEAGPGEAWGVELSFRTRPERAVS